MAMREIALFGAQQYKGAQHIIGMFFPHCRIVEHTQADLYIMCETENLDGEFVCLIRVRDENTEIAVKEQITEPDDEKKSRSCAYRAIYKALAKYTGKNPPWGILVGVRPVKLLQNMLKEGYSADQARNILATEYLVFPDKIEMLFAIVNVQQKVLESFSENGFSLYISIPFCPTKCSYCSFVSHSVEQAGHLIEPYLKKLSEEIDQLGEIAKQHRLQLDSIYIGGGTPTILTAKQLDGLFRAIAANFNVQSSREYTVEAGRPDTIDEEKLAMMRQWGVNRISINPQTMNDETLRIIGRNHTAKEVVTAFEAARKAGFDNINMDLIAGLPQENCDMFDDTLRQILDLDPQSITVHTLSIKKGSKMREMAKDIEEEPAAALMLRLLQEKLKETEYLPYYLYRQKNMLNGLENTGYCKSGKESIYNIAAMEEVQTILAAGAGAVTKIVNQKEEKIDRIFNYKYPYEYNRQVNDTTAVSALKTFFAKSRPK